MKTVIAYYLRKCIVLELKGRRDEVPRVPEVGDDIWAPRPARAGARPARVREVVRGNKGALLLVVKFPFAGELETWCVSARRRHWRVVECTPRPLLPADEAAVKAIRTRDLRRMLS